MTLNRYAKRVDANQDQVISALRAAGYTVEVIGKPVDLLVGNPRTKRMMFQEIKSKGGTKTKFQEGFFERWAGYPLSLVDSPECALRHARMLDAA